MYQCTQCSCRTHDEVAISHHMIEEHGVNHLSDYNKVKESEVKEAAQAHKGNVGKEVQNKIYSKIQNTVLNKHCDNLVKRARIHKIDDDVNCASIPEQTEKSDRSEHSPIKKTRGQTICRICGRSFNNNGRPQLCNCGNSLVRIVPSSVLNAFCLCDSVYSVREHRAGVGKRVFVNKDQSICYASDCLEVRSHYDEQSKFTCLHLKACVGENKSTKLFVNVTSLKPFINSSETLTTVEEASVDGILPVFLLPNEMLALSSFLPLSHECPSGMVHIDTKKMKCPLKKCGKSPGYHFLVKREMMCLHLLICKLVAQKSDTKHSAKSISVSPLFSKVKTAEFVVKKVRDHIPSALDEEKEQQFLQESFAFQTELLEVRDISDFVVEICELCEGFTEKRQKKTDNNLIVTPGFVVQVGIQTTLCKHCDMLFYPNLYHKGFVPISDNLLVTWSYLVDARNQLFSGNKIYSHFVHSLERLIIENSEIARGIRKIDVHNLAIKLCKERCKKELI